MTEPIPDEEMKIHSDVTCTVCGCVCDDLRIRVSGNRLEHIEPSCTLASPWFERLMAAQEISVPAAKVEGQPVSLEAGIERAAEILRNSRAPLIWGLSRSSTEGQRAAVALAERLGANIDTTASVCHASSIMAIQVVGESTSSLGEIKNRSDLVIYWGANPVVSHPRHMERYSADPTSDWLPQGRKDRTLVVVDHSMHETAERADLFIPVSEGRDFEAIWTLRQLIRGETPATNAATGADIKALEDLAKRMQSCRYGVVFFGLGLARTHLGYLNVEALLKLVAELNDHTRFTARRLRVPGNVSGADSVLCWQTGYPFGVNLARDYPRYNPGEFTAGELLEREEVDACLFVGSQDVEELSPQAREHLHRVPVISLDPPHQPNSIESQVQFTTSINGVHAPGTIYRMDETPLPLKSFLTTDYPGDSEVLERILMALPKQGTASPCQQQ